MKGLGFSIAGLAIYRSIVVIVSVLFSLTGRSEDERSEDEIWTQEIWTDVMGQSLFDAEQEPRFYGPPNQIHLVDASTRNSISSYISRVRGRFVAPQSGVYTFWLSTSDEGALFIGRDGSKWSRKKVALSSANTQFGEFDLDTHQQSSPVELQAGEEVFVEVISKGGVNGGHVQVAWSYHGNQMNWTQVEGVTAAQSRTVLGGAANRAIDGNRDGFFANRSVARTQKEGAWWEVDLGASRLVDALVLWNSQDVREYLSNFKVAAYDDQGVEIWSKSYYEEVGHVGSRLRIELSELMGEIPAVAKVRVESLGKNRRGGHLLSLAEVEVLGPDLSDLDLGSVYQARVLLPREFMRAYGADEDDTDQDELRDSWENQHGFSVGSIEQGDYSGMADPDRDGWNNVEESLFGSNPFVPDSFSGGWSLERWMGFPYKTTSQTVMDPRFYGEPDEVGVLEDGDTGELEGRHHATRLRGYVEAPISGDYQFWISGLNGVELHFSEVAENKYHKRRIAHLSYDDGAGSGVGINSQFRWDSFASQVSEKIRLEAGKLYYIEAIHQKSGHAATKSVVGVAWAPPGQERQVIPGNALYNYFVNSEDADDDYLPDEWEIAHGLSPSDNGGVDLVLQGERGDFDRDGLSNREEYLLGTDPSSADSDGDGLLDYDEYSFYGTSPLESNELAAGVAGVVDLGSHTASANWTYQHGGWVADNFRGEIAWDFTVPSDGWWVVELTARLMGDLRTEERFPLRFKINDSEMGIQNMLFRNSQPNNSKILTPYLQAGTHRLSLKLDNYIGRRNMQLVRLRILQHGGLDADENGIADWVEDAARVGSRIFDHSRESYVSPAFIEGATRYSNQIEVANPSGQVAVYSALGPQHWYANVPLHESGATPINVRFEQGQIERATTIDWVPWDVMVGDPPRVRIGDTLKLTLSNPDETTRILIKNGRRRTVFKVSEPESEHDFTFDQAGKYQFLVTSSVGKLRKFQILVQDPSLETNSGYVADHVSNVIFPKVSSSLFLDSGSGIEIVSQRKYRKGLMARIRSNYNGEVPLAVRLHEQGPIVTTGYLNAINYSDAIRGGTTQYSGEGPEGYYRLTTSIVITGLPEGGYAELVISKAGVTFLDGTRRMKVQQEDLRDGVLEVGFIYPSNMKGGYCHYIVFYDANGKVIAKR